jgi:hypothetical protein
LFKAIITEEKVFELKVFLRLTRPIFYNSDASCQYHVLYFLGQSSLKKGPKNVSRSGKDIQNLIFVNLDQIIFLGSPTTSERNKKSAGLFEASS